jgi:hypothetical protein
VLEIVLAAEPIVKPALLLISRELPSAVMGVHPDEAIAILPAALTDVVMSVPPDPVRPGSPE